MLDIIIHEVEKYLGLKAEKAKDPLLGDFVVHINDQIDIWLRDLKPGISVKSLIGNIPTISDKEEFFSYLCRANYIGQGTGGSVISMDPNEKFLTLSIILTYEVNYRIFRDKLEDFLNYLEFWKSELKRLETRQI
jgi:hypothetical protein